MKKSSLSPKGALQLFLMHYRRTPLPTGYSPSQLLNGRQMRCKIDILLPSPAHTAQFHQSRKVKRSTEKTVSKIHSYILGAPCYVLYHGPRRNRQPRWVPAIVTKIYGTRSLNVKVVPKAPTERRHVEQLRPRFSTEEDKDPGDKPDIREETKPQQLTTTTVTEQPPPRKRHRNPRQPDRDEYSRDNPEGLREPGRLNVNL